MNVLILLAATVFGQATVHSDQPGLAVRQAPLGGLPLCIWNDSSLFNRLKKGMQEADQHLFRYPNGSMSNEYHWNGSGRFDADSVWIPSDSAFRPGWTAMSIHRGCTKDGSGPSLIDDGDTTTEWWSDPGHPDAPGWFLLDFGSAVSIDSLALWLGDLKPDSVQILEWTGSSAPYPPPNQQFSGWQEIARLAVSGRTQATLPTFSTRYVGVKPIGGTSAGWKVREVEFWKAGTRASLNAADAASQTLAIATGAHPASRMNWSGSTWDFETYMEWIHGYPGAIPMISVNYGTGTAQEAAAWVRYANVVRKFGIQRWQVGNENSGAWEEGGAVSARQYATKYVEYVRAMKAVDTSIRVSGPLTPQATFVRDASGDFDGRSWMEGFLVYVDSVEKADGKRYLDGVDFHTYPYYYDGTSDRAAMLAACDSDGVAFDTLVALMARTISQPLTREIAMSEYNVMVGIRSVRQEEVSGASGAGLILAHFVQRFGDRGAAVFWQLYETGGFGTDGTYGSMGAFNTPPKDAWSSLGYVPNGSFWMLRTLLREWLDPAGGDTVVPVDQVPGARLFTVRNHGRISVLAFNFGSDSVSVHLDPSPFPSGDVLSWGSGEYNLIGTKASAYAFPDNGPSSRPIPAGWSGIAKIPPFGMAVVRCVRASAAPRTGIVVARAAKLVVGDSLIIAGWSQVDGSRLQRGIWRCGSASGDLVATDGAWDGPMESWTAHVPPSGLGDGSHPVTIVVTATAGDSAVDTLPVVVHGKPRLSLLISDFNDQTLKTWWGSSWYPFLSVDSSAAKVVTDSMRVRADSGLESPYLNLVGTIVQPAGLTYPNMLSAAFAVPAHFDSTVAALDIVGIDFDLKTSHSSSKGTFQLMTNSTAVTDWDVQVVALPNTKGQWVHQSILFDQLKQGGWGKVVGALDPKILTFIEFRALGAGEVGVALDNVAFLGTRGDPVIGVGSRAKTVPALSLLGRKLSISIETSWSLRVVGANGRVRERRSGKGPAQWMLEPSRGMAWAVLETPGRRTILPLSPSMR